LCIRYDCDEEYGKQDGEGSHGVFLSWSGGEVVRCLDFLTSDTLYNKVGEKSR
jgi:hypothetical protein